MGHLTWTGLCQGSAGIQKTDRSGEESCKGVSATEAEGGSRCGSSQRGGQVLAKSLAKLGGRPTGVMAMIQNLHKHGAHDFLNTKPNRILGFVFFK